MLKNDVFGSLNLNNSEIFRLSFEDIFLGTLDTYTKKMNPPSAVLGGGVHGKVCWLIAYNTVGFEKKTKKLSENSKLNPNNRYNRGFCNTFDYNLCMCSEYLLYTVTASGHIIL